MRFLLHNEDAVYDASTKVWEYHLDRRIANPTSLVVKKATFTPVSSLTVHPHVIYMHSRPNCNSFPSGSQQEGPQSCSGI